MALTAEEVRKIALLARLKLDDGEVELYRQQLLKILDSMAALDALDTKTVPPTTSVLGLKNVLRDDEPEPFADVESLLALAPEREGPFFKVRKVLE